MIARLSAMPVKVWPSGANFVLFRPHGRSGDEVWQDKYEAQGATGGAAQHSGPRSSPAVADGNGSYGRGETAGPGRGR